MKQTVIKIIAANIIILAALLLTFAGWNITDNIRQTFREDLQESFKDSLTEYGKK